MTMRPFVLLATVPLLLVLGCGEEKKEAQTSGPPADGLKELVKEDIVMGKPTKFNPKQKPVEKGDTVWVQYTGTLKSGKVFDTNDPKNKPDAKPFSFQVGTGTVIKGWEEGLLGMYPGGERKLSIPWKMAYGERGQGEIPPYSDLYFTIKVLEVCKEADQFVYSMVEEKVGSGPEAKTGSKVTVHYKATDVSGKVLEDTRDPKSWGKPVTFKIGAEEAVPAIEDGIRGMRPGGIRELAIPPIIGFQPSEKTGVSSNSFFYVRIELLKVE